MKQFDLLSTYLSWCIDELKPITIEYQLECYAKHGYINEGRKRDNLPSFEQWKKLES